MATEYFGRVLSVERSADVERLLDRGEADLALVVPPDFAKRAAAAAPVAVQVLVSGANSNTANAARGYAEVIVGRLARDLLLQSAATRGIATAVPGVEAEVRIWYNPRLAFKHFMAVSMIVVASLMVGVVTTAASLVRERESGTIEQLIVTPLRIEEIVAAKAVPPLAVSIGALVPSLIIAAAFGVPMDGSIGLFALGSVLLLVASMGIGLIVATFAETLQQALLIAFFVMFPLMFLSGTIVPVESMPAAMQLLSLASPVRYAMQIALGTLLKGVGWSALWPQLAALAAVALVIVVAGWMRVTRSTALAGVGRDRPLFAFRSRNGRARE